MALKRQCPEVREREAMALKCQHHEVREREAQVKSLIRQRPEFREREAQAKALKRQCPQVRKREAHAKKQSRVKQSPIPLSILQASEAFIMATREGPDYTCVLQLLDVPENSDRVQGHQT